VARCGNRRLRVRPRADATPRRTRKAAIVWARASGLAPALRGRQAGRTGGEPFADNTLRISVEEAGQRSPNCAVAEIADGAADLGTNRARSCLIDAQRESSRRRPSQRTSPRAAFRPAARRSHGRPAPPPLIRAAQSDPCVRPSAAREPPTYETARDAADIPRDC
jgi:hypothetical protein